MDIGMTRPPPDTGRWTRLPHPVSLKFRSIRLRQAALTTRPAKLAERSRMDVYRDVAIAHLAGDIRKLPGVPGGPEDKTSIAPSPWSPVAGTLPSRKRWGGGEEICWKGPSLEAQTRDRALRNGSRSRLCERGIVPFSLHECTCLYYVAFPSPYVVLQLSISMQNPRCILPVYHCIPSCCALRLPRGYLCLNVFDHHLIYHPNALNHHKLCW